jgi:hypothetical protein
LTVGTGEHAIVFSNAKEIRNEFFGEPSGFDASFGTVIFKLGCDSIDSHLPQ